MTKPGEGFELEPVGTPPGSVVVAVDASPPSERALEWATSRARRTHRPLHVVTPVTAAATRRPSDSLVEAAAEADVVVLGYDEAAPSGSLVSGSTATDVVSRVQCPVVVVKDREDPRRPRVGVVVGIDGSPASSAAIRFAFDEADRLHTFVDVVHARPGVRDQGPRALLADLARPHFEIEQRARLWMSESLSGVRAKHPDVEVNRLLLPQDPVSALLARSDGAQLLVVGSHGRGDLSRLLLGSVSLAVLRAAGAPVAVVRPVGGR